jgi:hypothetical protein
MPLSIPIAFSLAVMGFILIMPESPRCKFPSTIWNTTYEWKAYSRTGLIQVGRVNEAKSILSRLKDLSPEDSLINAEVEGIQYSLEESTVKKASMKDMFTMGPEKLFYRFCLCILLQFYQQMSGSNLISGTYLYLTTPFQYSNIFSLRASYFPTKSQT